MKVKICGVTHPDDAASAAREGADYIGMILSPHSKRQVTPIVAQEIAASARQGGAEPIAVFVEESAEQIMAFCEQADITIVQLHGKGSQSALDELIDRYRVIYALSVTKNGTLLQNRTLPPSVIPLYDTLSGGTGQPFDWSLLPRPQERQWMLAGGLNPQNVRHAIQLLKPHGVDVASGVEFPHATRKDPHLVKMFIHNAKQASETQ